MSDQAQGLRELVDQINEAYLRPTGPDKAKLWDDLKAELEFASRGRCAKRDEPGATGAFVSTSDGEQARRQLEYMLQMETLQR